MTKPAKSLITAYLLWLFLAGIGAHRFYLNRPLSGLSLACTNVLGIAFLVFGVLQELPEYRVVGSAMAMAVLAWWIVDAFFIPGIVRQLSEADRPSSFVSLGAVNMDPSFSATMVGANPKTKHMTRKSNLPEDYEMPWRKEREPPTVVRYRSED